MRPRLERGQDQVPPTPEHVCGRMNACGREGVEDRRAQAEVKVPSASPMQQGRTDPVPISGAAGWRDRYRPAGAAGVMPRG